MEWERVAAVCGADTRGSGYLVGPRLVLTSAHVAGSVAASVTVFRPGRAGQFAGRVVWSGTPGGRDDAALVLIDAPKWRSLPGRVRFGRSVTHEPGLRCESWGVPDVVQRQGNPVEVAQPTGTLNPGDRMVADRYLITLDGHPPGTPEDGGSPWAGLSGAAVFSAELLIGVVATDPAGRAHAVLEAAPIYLLWIDESFLMALAAHDAGTGELAAVELTGLADPESARAPAGPPGSPAGLLPARRATVPFHGRETLLAELREWAERPGLGVWLLHGPGGQGKTRLAHRFGCRLARDRWAVLWLRAAAARDDLAVLARTVAPILVIIDYAETRPRQLTALLEALTRRAVRVKVLLLARTAGSWWDELDTGSDVVRDLRDTAHLHRLRPLDDTALDRQRTYHTAAAAFADTLATMPAVDAADWRARAARLAARTFPEPTTVLAIQMAALADLLDTGGTTRQARGPEDRLLAHERRYWRDTADAHGIDLSLETLTEVIAATVLLEPPAPRDTDTWLRRIPGLADQTHDQRRRVATWIAHVYPSEDPQRAFGGLQPDRLAEWLIGTTPGVLRALATTLTAGDAVRFLTVGTRAAAHAAFTEQLAPELSRLCVRHPETLGLAAIAVIPLTEVPAPLLDALDYFADDETLDINILLSLFVALPHRSHRLAGAAAAIAGNLVARHRELGGEIQVAVLAWALNRRSIWLDALGRLAEALAAISRAVGLYRTLADQDPDAYLPELAGGLNNQALQLQVLGRREEALAASTEAVELYRALSEQDQNTYLPYVAGSLDTQSMQLNALGRQEEALEASTTAVRIRVWLAATQHPAARDSDLANSLGNQSIWLQVLGRPKEALGASVMALQVYRTLVARHPDAYLSDYAKLLYNLAAQLGELERWDEALGPARMSMLVWFQLAEQRPDAYVAGLAGSLNVYAAVLGKLKRHAEALTVIGEALPLHRAVAARHPDVQLPALAASLHNQSHQLNALGRRDEALAAITEAVGIWRQLTAKWPAAFQDKLDTSLAELRSLEKPDDASPDR